MAFIEPAGESSTNQHILLSFSEQISGGTGTDTTFSFEPQVTARGQSPGFEELNTEIEAARLQSLALDKSRTAIKDKLAKKEKKKDKKKKKNSDSDTLNNSVNNMSEVEAAELNGASGHSIPQEMLPSDAQLEEDARERAAEEERRKNREPPIVFKDIDVSAPPRQSIEPVELDSD